MNIISSNRGKRRKNKQMKDAAGPNETNPTELVDPACCVLVKVAAERNANFENFMFYKRQKELSNETPEPARGDPETDANEQNAFETIQEWTRMFIEEQLVRKTGDYGEKIAEKWVEFMTSLFQCLVVCADTRPSLKFAPVFTGEFFLQKIWPIILDEDGDCEFPSLEGKGKFFTAAIKAFWKLNLVTGASDLPKVDRSMIYTGDPITRQAIRLANRKRLGLGQPKGSGNPTGDHLLNSIFGSELTPLVFINKILSNVDRLIDVPLAHFAGENRIVLALDMVLTILELGLIDAFSCDLFLSSLDCFASALQFRFRESDKVCDRAVVNEGLAVQVFKMRNRALQILLHASSVYCDQAFEKMGRQVVFRPQDKSKFVMAGKSRFSSIAHVFASFVAGQNLEYAVYSHLSSELPVELKTFCKDSVTILNLLNDGMYDHFVVSWKALALRQEMSGEADGNRDLPSLIPHPPRGLSTPHPGTQQARAQRDPTPRDQALAYLSKFLYQGTKSSTLGELQGMVKSLFVAVTGEPPKPGAGPDSVVASTVASPSGEVLVPKETRFDIWRDFTPKIAEWLRKVRFLGTLKAKTDFQPYLSKLGVLGRLGVLDKARVLEVESQLAELIDKLGRKSPLDSGELRKAVRDFLKAKTSLAPETVDWARFGNIPNQVAMYLVHFHEHTGEVWDAEDEGGIPVFQKGIFDRPHDARVLLDLVHDDKLPLVQLVWTLRQREDLPGAVLKSPDLKLMFRMPPNQTWEAYLNQPVPRVAIPPVLIERLAKAPANTLSLFQKVLSQPLKERQLLSALLQAPRDPGLAASLAAPRASEGTRRNLRALLATIRTPEEDPLWRRERSAKFFKLVSEIVANNDAKDGRSDCLRELCRGLQGQALAFSLQSFWGQRPGPAETTARFEDWVVQTLRKGDSWARRAIIFSLAGPLDSVNGFFAKIAMCPQPERDLVNEVFFKSGLETPELVWEVLNADPEVCGLFLEASTVPNRGGRDLLMAVLRVPLSGARGALLQELRVVVEEPPDSFAGRLLRLFGDFKDGDLKAGDLKEGGQREGLFAKVLDLIERQPEGLLGSLFASGEVSKRRVLDLLENRPPSRAGKAVSQALDWLVLLVQQDLGLKTSLLSTKNSLAFKGLPDLDTATSFEIGNPTPRDYPSDYTEDGSGREVLREAEAWPGLCFLQPGLFAGFIRDLFGMDFGLFLHEKEALLGLLQYYEITLVKFLQALVDQWNMASDVSKQTGGPKFRPPKEDVRKTIFCRLLDLEKAVCVWNKLLERLLKEFLRATDSSNGLDYCSRVYSLICHVVKSLSFSPKRREGPLYENWDKPAGPDAAAEAQGQAQVASPETRVGTPVASWDSAYAVSKKTELGFLRLLNISTSVLCKLKCVSGIKSAFLDQTKKVFGRPVAADAVAERAQFFSLYSKLFNFEKNTIFDEFTVMVSNPDISLISEKFRPADFNSIYNIENVLFLLEEGRRIVEALRRAIPGGNATLSEDVLSALGSSPLPSYAWKHFMLAVYKLLKGITVFYFTKITAVDFPHFVATLRSLIQVSRQVAALTAAVFLLATIDSKDPVAYSPLVWPVLVEQRLTAFEILPDNLKEPFSHQTANSKSGLFADSLQSDVLQQMTLEIQNEIGRFMASFVLFYSLSVEALDARRGVQSQTQPETPPVQKPRSPVLEKLDSILSLYHRALWRVERFEISRSGSIMTSFAEYGVPSQAASHWSSDPAFLGFLNQGIQSICRKRQRQFRLQERQLKEWLPFANSENWDQLPQDLRSLGSSVQCRNGIEARLAKIEMQTGLDKACFQNGMGGRIFAKAKLADSRETTEAEAKDKESHLIRERCKGVDPVHWGFIRYYLRMKNSAKSESLRKTWWSDLFDSAAELRVQVGSSTDTERQRTLHSLSSFLIDFSTAINTFYGSLQLNQSLGYFDPLTTSFNLAWQFFMRNVSEVLDACNDKIEERNQREMERRNVRRYNPLAAVQSTTHENFYELYFNLLNLMYWRVNDGEFQWMYQQFVVLNQLISTIKNVRETSSSAVTEGDSRVRNPIEQILLLLEFLTANSRLYQNDGLRLDFSDRAGDLPLLAVLLNNLSYSVKSYGYKHISLESNYFESLHHVITRKVCDKRSQLYEVQYNGIDSVQAFLLKANPASMIKIWNSFDHIGLYKHMIWLVKFWFTFDKVGSRHASSFNGKRKQFKTWLFAKFERRGSPPEGGTERTGSTGGPGDRDPNRRGPWGRSGALKPGLNERETLINIDKQLLEDMMDEEMVGLWDHFTARGNFLRLFNFSKGASDKVLDFFWDAVLEVLVQANSSLQKKRDPVVIGGLMDEYAKIPESDRSEANQSIKTAAQIFIFLKYLGSSMLTVRNFMEEKERKATAFNLKGAGLDPRQTRAVLAEYKCLLFLNTIVRQIEIVKPRFDETDKAMLTTVYFRCNPVSLFRTPLIAKKFEQRLPWASGSVSARRTYLLDKNASFVTNLKRYRDNYHRVGVLYLFAHKGTILVFQWLSFFMCITLFILLMVYAIPAKNGSPGFDYKSDDGRKAVEGVNLAYMAVRSIHLVLVTLYFLLFMVPKVRATLAQRAFAQKRDESSSVSQNKLWIWQAWLSKIFFYFRFPVLFCLFAYLGFFVNPIFIVLNFLFTTLELPYFRYIFDSIVGDWKRIGLLLLFLVFILLFTSYVIFLRFAFDPKNANVQSDCPFYLHCFFNTFIYAYINGGGVADRMAFIFNFSTPNYLLSFFLSLLFFLVVKQIIFNIITGIIQDKLATSRETQDAIDEQLKYCYICNAESLNVARFGGTFDDHIHHQHSIWNYQDYLIYLQESDYGVLTDYDVKIKRQIDHFNFDWMPEVQWLRDEFRPEEASTPNEE